MLVPSTFTGWYKKMMMKAEIASEMIRSRTQTPSPLVIRGGAFDANSATDPAVGAGATISAAELGSESVPDMFAYCIEPLALAQVVFNRQIERRTVGLTSGRLGLRLQ